MIKTARVRFVLYIRALLSLRRLSEIQLMFMGPYGDCSERVDRFIKHPGCDSLVVTNQPNRGSFGPSVSAICDAVGKTTYRRNVPTGPCYRTKHRPSSEKDRERMGERERRRERERKGRFTHMSTLVRSPSRGSNTEPSSSSSWSLAMDAVWYT